MEEVGDDVDAVEWSIFIVAVVVDTLEVAVCDVATFSWSFTLTVVWVDAPATSAVGLFDKKHLMIGYDSPSTKKLLWYAG